MQQAAIPTQQREHIIGHYFITQLLVALFHQPLMLEKQANIFHIQLAITSGTGYIIASGYFFGQSSNDVTASSDILNMGCDVSGYIPDQMVLCIQQLAAGTTTANIVASLNWVEQL